MSDTKIIRLELISLLHNEFLNKEFEYKLDPMVKGYTSRWRILQIDEEIQTEPKVLECDMFGVPSVKFKNLRGDEQATLFKVRTPVVYNLLKPVVLVLEKGITTQATLLTKDLYQRQAKAGHPVLAKGQLVYKPRKPLFKNAQVVEKAKGVQARASLSLFQTLMEVAT